MHMERKGKRTQVGDKDTNKKSNYNKKEKGMIMGMWNFQGVWVAGAVKHLIEEIKKYGMEDFGQDF